MHAGASATGKRSEKKMQRMTVCPNVHNAYDHWGKLFKAVSKTSRVKISTWAAFSRLVAAAIQSGETIGRACEWRASPVQAIFLLGPSANAGAEERITGVDGAVRDTALDGEDGLLFYNLLHMPHSKA